MKRKRRPDPVKFEALARGVARGKSVHEAAVDAGFGPRSKWIYSLSNRPEFQARVEALEREIPLAGPNMAPVLMALMAGANAALEERSGPGWTAAARMLAEAARIKKSVPDVDLERDRRREEHEWLLRYGPRD
jgi:hypothetical protein